MKKYEDLIKKIVNKTFVDEEIVILEKALIEFNNQVEKGMMKKRESILPSPIDKDRLRYTTESNTNIRF